VRIHSAALESDQNIFDILGSDGVSLLPPELGRPLLMLESNKFSELKSNSIHYCGVYRSQVLLGANSRFCPICCLHESILLWKVTNGTKQHVHRLFGFFFNLARDLLCPKHSGSLHRGAMFPAEDDWCHVTHGIAQVIL